VNSNTRITRKPIGQPEYQLGVRETDAWFGECAASAALPAPPKNRMTKISLLV
jgi:hypothetical protein